MKKQIVGLSLAFGCLAASAIEITYWRASYLEGDPSFWVEISFTGANTTGSDIKGGVSSLRPLPGAYPEDTVEVIAQSGNGRANIYFYFEGLGFRTTDFDTATGQILTTMTSLDISQYIVDHPYRTLFYDPTTGAGKLRWADEPTAGVSYAESIDYPTWGPPEEIENPVTVYHGTTNVPDLGAPFTLMLLGVVSVAVTAPKAFLRNRGGLRR